MPELPEIETVKLQLGRVLVGATLEGVEVKNAKTVHGDVLGVAGKKIVAIRRRAKVLLIDLEGDLTMAFHFKMSGQLIYDGYKSQITNSNDQVNSNDPNNNFQTRIVGGHPTADFVSSLPSPHTRVIFKLDRGVLYFNDQRMFGWVKIFDQLSIDQMPFFKDLGPEPWDMQEDDFVKMVQKSKKAVKLVIMDQTVLSGVGNIYANDALWEAGIKPQFPSNQLSNDQLKLLFNKIKLVLEEGIQYGGATAADAKYIDLHGLGGHYQEHFRTYDREGLPCLRCGKKIIKGVLGGRGTYWCPQCQK